MTKLPPIKAGETINPETKPRQVKAWLDGLPLGEPVAAAVALLKYLAACNRSQLPQDRRDQLMTLPGPVVSKLRGAPRLFGIQAEGSAAVSNAYLAGVETIVPVSAQTLADSISVDLPRDGIRAVRAARETGGTYILVSDQEILTAIAVLGKVGIFAEPAGATAYAGLVKAVRDGIITPDDPVVVINTGSGLKDVKAAMQAAGEAVVIEPTLDALKRVIK